MPFPLPFWTPYQIRTRPGLCRTLAQLSKVRITYGYDNGTD
jgi:hypothetical protein